MLKRGRFTSPHRYICSCRFKLRNFSSFRPLSDSLVEIPWLHEEDLQYYEKEFEKWEKKIQYKDPLFPQNGYKTLFNTDSATLLARNRDIFTDYRFVEDYSGLNDSEKKYVIHNIEDYFQNKAGKKWFSLKQREINENTFKKVLFKFPISLDINADKGPQKMTFPDIVRDNRLRMEKRYAEPSTKWSVLKQFSGETDLPRHFSAQFKPDITPSLLWSSIDIGDAVELSTSLNRAVLAVIAELPSDMADPRYTFITHKGEVVFGAKSAIKFRIPRVFPKEYLKDAVVQEKNIAGLDPIGSVKESNIMNENITLSSLADSSQTTFIVPNNARQAIVRPLLKLTQKSWEILPIISRKLEILHRILQNPQGPVNLSLFTMIRALELIDVREVGHKFKMAKTNRDQVYIELAEKISHLVKEDIQFGNFHLGREIGSLDGFQIINGHEFYALILALRKQSRLWGGLNMLQGIKTPISVTVLPLEKSLLLDDIIFTLKKDPSVLFSFTNHCELMIKDNQNGGSTPKHYGQIVELLRNYASGDLIDAPAETMVTNLLRNISIYKSKDLSRTTAYDLLIRLGLIEGNENPAIWSNELQLPKTNTSLKANLEQDYYETLDNMAEKDQISDFEEMDRMELIREDFGELSVYCIDSEDAHEIDDGVSLIKHSDSNWEILVHIADPASFIKPDSTLFKIAYERSFTTYLPEQVIPMLPHKINELAGLGIDGKPTRCMTFSFCVNPLEDPLKDKYVDKDSFRVRAGIVRKFPKVTYKKVDEILHGDVEEVSFKPDLEALYSISSNLEKMRLKNGAFIFGESSKKQFKVMSPNNKILEEGESLHVSFNDSSRTKSQILVSELMIAANQVSGQVSVKHGIPGIFKRLDKMPCNTEISDEFAKMNKKAVEQGELPSMVDVLRMSPFLSAAFYSSNNGVHSMLGVPVYQPSTSPLRRFNDLIVHKQLHSMLLGEELPFNLDQMCSIAFHIQSRDLILKKVEKKSTAFWISTYLSKIIAIDASKNVFNCMVVSAANDGNVSIALVDYGVYANLKLNLDCKPPKVGDILKGEIYDLDILEGELLLRAI